MALVISAGLSMEITTEHKSFCCSEDLR